MIQIIFGAVTFLVGITLAWLGFSMEYEVNFVMVGIGFILTITGYKVIF